MIKTMIEQDIILLEMKKDHATATSPVSFLKKEREIIAPHHKRENNHTEQEIER